MKNNSSINKSALAKKLDISRSSLYYKSRTDQKDEILKEQIIYVMSLHPAYGHRRVAIELRVNKKRALRVMKKFNLEPEKQRSKKPKKKKTSETSRLNMKTGLIKYVP